MGDYLDFYLKTDVLLLADLFEKFINPCLDCYGLDPCHYFSYPGLSWDAMLKATRTELDLVLLKDIVKQKVNTCSPVIVLKKVNTLLIFIQIIYMVGQ